MEISSAERVRFLAVQIGLQRGAGIYGETSCINRQAFSIEEIKNVMFLLSKGYREVNFEVVSTVFGLPPFSSSFINIGTSVHLDGKLFSHGVN